MNRRANERRDKETNEGKSGCMDEFGSRSPRTTSTTTKEKLRSEILKTGDFSNKDTTVSKHFKSRNK